MDSQKSIDRGGDQLTFDPSRGRRLKYHAAYASNPDFDNATNDPQIVSLAATYDHSPLVADQEADDFGQWGGRQSAKVRVLAAVTSYDGSIESNPDIRDELLDAAGRGINEEAMFATGNRGGAAPITGANPQLAAFMRQAAYEAEGMAPIQGGPVRQSQYREAGFDPRTAAGMNPTDIPEGGHTAYVADRYEDGTPGMGDQYAPEERYPFDQRPFVEASPKAGQRRTARTWQAGEPVMWKGQGGEEPATVVQSEEQGDGSVAVKIRFADGEEVWSNEGEFRSTSARQPVRQRMAPGVMQRRPTFAPQASRTQGGPPRVTATIQQQALQLLRQAEAASAQGMHGKAAILERKAENLIQSLEGRRASGRQATAADGPARPVPPPSGFDGSGADIPMDDEEIQSGFAGFDTPGEED